MRTTADRIRHAISFEVIALLMVTPLAAWIYGLPMADTGVIGIGSAVIAMVWTYLYNLGFDHLMMRIKGRTTKGLALRVVHTIAFEAGLVAILLPPIAWYLDIGIVDAFLLDAGITVFFLVYAFVFNLGYDRMFPVPGEAA